MVPIPQTRFFFSKKIISKRVSLVSSVQFFFFPITVIRTENRFKSFVGCADSCAFLPETASCGRERLSPGDVDATVFSQQAEFRESVKLVGKCETRKKQQTFEVHVAFDSDELRT
jgi:hypothetical protein